MFRTMVSDQNQDVTNCSSNPNGSEANCLIGFFKEESNLDSVPKDSCSNNIQVGGYSGKLYLRLK